MNPKFQPMIFKLSIIRTHKDSKLISKTWFCDEITNWVDQIQRWVTEIWAHMVKLHGWFSDLPRWAVLISAETRWQRTNPSRVRTSNTFMTLILQFWEQRHSEFEGIKSFVNGERRRRRSKPELYNNVHAKLPMKWRHVTGMTWLVWSVRLGRVGSGADRKTTGVP